MEKSLIEEGCTEKPPLSSKGKEGKSEAAWVRGISKVTYCKSSSFCKFTIKEANESQRVHTTGCSYSNQVLQLLLIVMVRTLLLTFLE